MLFRSRRSEPALHHAKLSLSLCQAHGLEDFALAYAHEALCRAYALAEEWELAQAHRELALQVEMEDREELEKDLESIPKGRG